MCMRTCWLDYHYEGFCNEAIFGDVLVSGFKILTRPDIIIMTLNKSRWNDTLNKRLIVELDANNVKSTAHSRL